MKGKKLGVKAVNFFVVKSNVPRVPVPEVAVTKFSSTTLPSVSVSS